MPITLNVLSDCDRVYLAWESSSRIPQCLGFAIMKRPATVRSGDGAPLPSWVGFQGQTVAPGTSRPTTAWPIQKFMWADYAATDQGACYRIVPMTGADQDHLTPRTDLASPWSDAAALRSAAGDGLSAFFNRGVVATQHIARALGPVAPGTRLQKSITTPGDPLRNYLAGAERPEMLALLAGVKASGGSVYAALFELDDPDLLAALATLGKRANVLLANGAVKKKGQDENAAARKALSRTANVYRRFTAPRALAHNKFLVICDRKGRPTAVWTGSTNWTCTGLCTQANNGLLVEHPKIGAAFLATWKALRAAKDGTPDALRASHATPARSTKGSTTVTAWFAPTPAQEELEQATALINAAKQGVLFLMFDPGPRGTLLNAIIERLSPGSASYAPDLYVHGVVNQDPETTKNPIAFFHRGERSSAAWEDIVLPEAVDQQSAFWVKELLKLPTAHAMVHSKVVVIDPFGDKPAVITGSHNLGPRASSVNDENLLIIEGNASLAAAYAVNIMGVYDQYRWRYVRSQSRKAGSWAGLVAADTWQDPWFTDPRHQRELTFWK